MRLLKRALLWIDWMIHSNATLSQVLFAIGPAAALAVGVLLFLGVGVYPDPLGIGALIFAHGSEISAVGLEWGFVFWNSWATYAVTRSSTTTNPMGSSVWLDAAARKQFLGMIALGVSFRVAQVVSLSYRVTHSSFSNEPALESIIFLFAQGVLGTSFYLVQVYFDAQIRNEQQSTPQNASKRWVAWVGIALITAILTVAAMLSYGVALWILFGGLGTTVGTPFIPWLLAVGTILVPTAQGVVTGVVASSFNYALRNGRPRTISQWGTLSWDLLQGQLIGFLANIGSYSAGTLAGNVYRQAWHSQDGVKVALALVQQLVGNVINTFTSLLNATAGVGFFRRWSLVWRRMRAAAAAEGQGSQRSSLPSVNRANYVESLDGTGLRDLIESLPPRRLRRLIISFPVSMRRLRNEMLVACESAQQVRYLLEALNPAERERVLAQTNDDALANIVVCLSKAPADFDWLVFVLSNPSLREVVRRIARQNRDRDVLLILLGAEARLVLLLRDDTLSQMIQSLSDEELGRLYQGLLFTQQQALLGRLSDEDAERVRHADAVVTDTLEPPKQ